MTLLTIIFAVSILLQLAAVYFSVRLIKTTGWLLSWSLIALALLLMASRRIISLYHALQSSVPPESYTAEIVALCISALMVAGVAMIGPVFEARKKEQEIIQKSEQTLKRAQEIARFGCWDWDIANDHLIWDESMFRLYGIRRDDFSDTYESWSNALYKDDVLNAKQAVNTSIAEKKPLKTVFRIVKPASGEIRYIEASAEIVCDDKGHVQRMVGINWDITDRVLSEHRQRDLANIMEESLNEIYIFDSESLKYIDVNLAARKNLGYTMTELKQLTPVDIKPGFTLEKFQDMIAPLKDGSLKQIVFQTIHQRKDNSTYWADVHLQKSTFENKSVYCAMILDITERKQAEEALRRAQKMEAVGQLSGGIAHDFNNQLNIIIGFLDILKKHAAKDDQTRNWIENATTATLRCISLTRQLLTFSRGQSQDRKIVNLNDLLREMENMITRSVTPEIEVEYFPAEDLALTEIDPGEFQDVLLNLVINARDAMPGSGKLLIETSNKHLDEGDVAINPNVKAGDYVQLMLSDTGNGMDQATLEHVFEPFFTTKPEGKGTGLGLAMIYGFVNRHGGYIKIYSEPDVGTTIRIYLPRSPATVPSVIVENDPDDELPGGHETVLIVDDEADLLKLSNQYLTELGYRTFLAENAAQALEILAKEQIDLLFSDVVMPGGMNGYELAQQATALKPGLKVLLTSGFTSQTIARNGQARFSASILNKPYRKHDVAQRVRFALDADTGAA